MTSRLRAALLLIFVLVLTFDLPSRASAYDLALSQGTKAEVYFSPNGGATEAIVKHLKQAQHTVCVLAYSFTSPAIAQALIEAMVRGVDVRVILDKSQSRGQGAAGNSLRATGVKVYIDSAHAIAHNKVMLIDRHTLITGSFNFTKSAEVRNAENLMVLASPGVVALYMEEFRRHLGHSQYISGD